MTELWAADATEVSERSHRQVGWRMVEENDTIPYEAVYLAPRFEITDSMRAKAAELADASPTSSSAGWRRPMGFLSGTYCCDTTFAE